MTDRAAGNRIPVSALVLGLAGLVPFAAAAVSQWIAIPALPAGMGFRLGVIYGAVILSFLGGIRWGTAIGPYGPRRQAVEFSTSVIPPLAALAAVFMPDIPGLSLLIAAFLMQALWDVLSVEAGRLPLWFGKLRMVLTSGAVISLIALLVRLFI